jgi:hypothetical protein
MTSYGIGNNFISIQVNKLFSDAWRIRSEALRNIILIENKYGKINEKETKVGQEAMTILAERNILEPDQRVKEVLN